MAKPKWRCARCGAGNDESLARCRLCQTARPEARPSPAAMAAPPPPTTPTYEPPASESPASEPPADEPELAGAEPTGHEPSLYDPSSYERPPSEPSSSEPPSSYGSSPEPEPPSWSDAPPTPSSSTDDRSAPAPMRAPGDRIVTYGDGRVSPLEPGEAGPAPGPDAAPAGWAPGASSPHDERADEARASGDDASGAAGWAAGASSWAGERDGEAPAPADAAAADAAAAADSAPTEIDEAADGASDAPAPSEAAYERWVDEEVPLRPGPGLPPMPPIGPQPAPVPAAAPDAGGPTGPDRRVLIAGGAIAAVVLVVIAALVMSSGGGGSSSTLSPDETVGELLPETTARAGPDIPTENRAAVAMLPTKGDFGPLWSQIELRAGKDAFELGPDPSSAQCVLPPPAVPEAGARVDLGSYVEGGSVSAQVKVFADPNLATTDLNTAPITADITACLQRVAAAELGKFGIADVVSVDVGFTQLGPPGLGEESVAYQLTESISGAGRQIVRTVDLVGFRIGRTVGQLTVTAGFNQDNGPLLTAARDTFTSRFVPQ